MRFSRARTEEVLRALVHEIRAERLTFMAGSIAYHAFLSILPLLLLVLTFVQRTENAPLRASVVGIMEAVLTAQASGIIQQGLTEADASVSALGVGFLLWGRYESFEGWIPPSPISTRLARRTRSSTSSATACYCS